MTKMQLQIFPRHVNNVLTLWAVVASSLATIGGAWIFESFGYLPCELCLKQRIAYYLAIPLAVLLIGVSQVKKPVVHGFTRFGMLALAFIFLGNAGLGTYHAGVEWGFWPGPAECTGAISSALTVNEFLKQLDTVKVVRCDDVALRIFGLSLAGWNVIISVFLFSLTFTSVKNSKMKL